LELYRKQEWDMANQRLLELQKLQPKSVLYEMFIERVALLREAPPGPGWDGAFTFHTK
jgi:adenylate cyclase